MPNQLVEIGFELVLPSGPFFTLDDAIKGQLDNTIYKLAGFQYYDITNYVTSIQVTRGKSDDIETISAGELVVELNNRTRAFDPTYVDGPFYGNILPKRVVRYTVNGIQQYQGVLDDWGLNYTPDGDATANFVASDGFVYLNNQTLPAGTATAQLSGARVEAILDDQYVKWPATERDIDPGTRTLGANPVLEGQGALEYLQSIETSESGTFFISKTGKATFLDRSHTPSTTNLVSFADDGTGIAYQNLQISYGSEDLANEIDATSVITETQISGVDLDSQAEFGIFNLSFDKLLLSTDAQVESFVATLLAKYSQPVYRFSEIEVRLNDLSVANQNKVLGLELGDFVQVIFTPSNIPPAINLYAAVIRADHNVDITGEHIMTLGLNTLNLTYFVWDDPIFGRLDFNSYFD
jgi:hypothetical protein